MLKLILFIALAYAAYALFKRSGNKEVEQKSESDSPVELVKDPSCGTFVEKTTNYKVKFYDNIYYFCSEECRQKFIKKMKSEE
ncbi:MAG: YHS domain-containing protein [Calditerrivibrio sp.]|nr:YHS domain-containing protein [Calditerrivibrio sp.]MCA1933564.1 YHS domain-containing protein [Calditerrivibrio sp.]MCA1980457.1 YHS domain-containing protein [Calditerrivibrio sp.]